MSEKRPTVRVTIAGEEYSIRSGETAEHTRAVAQYLDEAIRRVLQSGSLVETQRAAILAALQVTSELFHTRSARDQIDAELRALSAEVRRWLPPAKRGDAPSEAREPEAPENQTERR